MTKLVESFFSQFAHPRERMGWFVGHLMAWKNGARRRWALELLSRERGDLIRAVGVGPGFEVRGLLECVGEGGLVAGVDVAVEMGRQARARNRAAIAAGRARLERGSPERLPFDDCAFDAVYSANSAQFWPDLTAAMTELRRVLSPSGRAVVVVQPMWRGATEADTAAWEAKL